MLCVCEKVIIDRTTGTHSLISVMVSAEARFASPPNSGPPDDLPPNAVVPSQWFVYAMWETSEEDDGKVAEQVLEVRWPNGDIFLSNRLPFTADKTMRAQNSVGMVSFPLGQKGDLKIRAWIERDGNCISNVAEGQVTVRHPETV